MIERLPVRPRRRMPTLLAIARYHGLGEVSYCVRCGYRPPWDHWGISSTYLERAHIIDRCFDGLDVAPNLAPLCSWCHRTQPIFKPGDEAEAYAWFGLRPKVVAILGLAEPKGGDSDAA